MRRLTCGALLLVAQLLVAQQQGTPPYHPPPHSTPPTIPQNHERQGPFPPDTKAPPPGELSNPEIEKILKETITAQPSLANAGLNVAVDDESLVITGTVDDEQQHQLALRIAHSYAGKREIVDKIQVQQKT
jgi:hypothetical protein